MGAELRAALLALAALPALAGAGPRIEHWRTEGGVPVYFVQAPELPMVDVQIVFDAGSARDGDRPGLAALTASLLEEGAGPWDADALAARFEGLGARFGVEAGRDSATVSLRSLTDAELLAPAVETLRAVLAKPRLDPGAFERERRRMLVGLQAAEESPGAVAERAFYRALYGDHPYGSPPEGTRASLEGLTPADVVAFHRRHYVTGNALVAIVGALDRRGAERLAARLAEAIPRGPAAPPLPPVPDLPGPRLIRIPHPSTQTHILVGAPGIRRDDPDLFPLYVGNYVLGGSGLVSRLSEEVRERRGLAYSVYSYFLPMRRRGPFQLGLQTRNERAEEALGVVREVLGRYLREGPTAQELEAARRGIVGGFPLRIDSNRKILGYLTLIGYHGLGLDYLERFTERVEAVTAEQVREAFRRHLDPARMVTVLVGGGAAGE
ncbi:M16 family metallopeptidase [Inmirania thermothiophila]|uniref:Zinc protease n=1 Tax=Inmirania thermothiophila TaxID=1750597 RepID=A0A3N1YA10_9GAMM|nr:pitrilysin family protein [Inmirania thermothiophila]ROR34237.1 zinc protease [Inmirania thermothiophila]